MSSHPTRWHQPVFVASMGRSGSTLLQRVLNVHPQLTVWGEHGAFLKGILSSFMVTTTDSAVTTNLADGFENRASVIGPLSEVEAFKPWVSPFTTDDVSTGLRDFVIELFTRDLTEEIRWGFKEIRYTEVELERLLNMFAKGHLIVLARDVPGYAASRFFAFGNSEFDLVSEQGREKASKRVATMANGWVTRYQGLLGLADTFGDRMSFVAYSDLVSGSQRPAELFAELGETAPPSEAIEAVLGAKSGSSYTHNPEARENRERLAEIIATADYDRAEVGRLSMMLGLA